ncbi:hypothetical protein VUR80DRAFT_5280 [Thermomyces stellatus]
MLTKSVLVSSFAALALAEAAAHEPRITQAPVRRQTFGDAGDDIDDFLDEAGTRLGDIGAGASSLLGDLGDGASSLIGDIGGGVQSLGACAEVVASLDIPTPTGDLMEAFASAAIDERETDICKIAEDLDDDIKEQWEDFRSSASSWYAENSEAVSSAVKACPSALGIGDAVADLDCITGGSNGGDSDSDSDGDDGPDDAATKVTGLAMAAAGAAVGVVAVML